MRYIFSLTLLLLASAVLAHEPQPVERIEVTGHYENGVGTTDAASAGTVTSTLIENRPLLRPGEILEFVPGAIVTQHSGGGKANQYFLRGFNLDHGTDFATWVDGMPVNMRTHAHGQGYTDLNFLIPELVDRIHYAKGPYSAAEGDFSSAGAAHIELVDRVTRPTATLTTGSFGHGRAFAAASPRVVDGTLLAAVEAAQTEGPWTNPEGLRRWSGVLRYARDSAQDRWTITLMGYDARWRATDQIPQRAVDAGTLARFDAVDPSDGGTSSRYSASAHWHRSTEASLLQATAFAVRSRLDLFSNFTYFLDDPVRGDQFEQAERRDVAGLNASYRLADAIAGRDTSHTFGIQSRVDRIAPIALYRTQRRERLEATSEDGVEERSAGVYYENATRWTGAWRSVAGIRYDRYRFAVTPRGQDARPAISGAIVSPKVSLVWTATPVVEAFGNWGRGFHSNDARGVTAPADPATPLVRTDGGELGLRIEPLRGLQSSLSLWRLALASELVFQGDAGTTEASRASRRSGAEWSNHYAISRHWLLDLDVAVSRARFTPKASEGDFIPGSIERVASFTVAMNDIARWSGAFELRHFGPRPLTTDNSIRSSGTTLAYLRAGYRIDEHWRVGLDVFNLFDRKSSDIEYEYASRLPGEAPGGVAGIHFHPVEPRSWRLTLTARF